MTHPAAALEQEPTTALALLEHAKPLELFSNNGLDPIISKIEEEARSTYLDISTEKGRKEIKSLAFKIAKSKTALDEMGKELTTGLRSQVNQVDAERRKAWDRLEALQKEIRAPLTEWEKKEKDRIAGHEAAIAEIIAGGRYSLENWQALSEEAMGNRLKEIEADASRDWQEFAGRAKLAIEVATTSIRAAIEKRQAYDAQQAELERLRREEAERKQREHEERLKDEAAAQAKAEAEEAARIAAEKEAARVKAERERAEQERLRIERAKAEAEERAQKAEQDRLAAITQAEANRVKAEADAKEAAKKAEEERKAVVKQAKRDAETAVLAERQRAEAAQRREAEATAKREADKKHRAKIEGDALAALVQEGLSELDAKVAIEAIAAGLIPYIKISY